LHNKKPSQKAFSHKKVFSSVFISLLQREKGYRLRWMGCQGILHIDYTSSASHSFSTFSRWRRLSLPTGEGYFYPLEKAIFT
jgi:hypothetical protein